MEAWLLAYLQHDKQVKKLQIDLLVVAKVVHKLHMAPLKPTRGLQPAVQQGNHTRQF